MSTITRFVIKKGDKYYSGPKTMMWGPIYEARLFDYKPNIKFEKTAEIVLVNITFKEVYNVQSEKKKETS